jgi:hypothetical protein
MKLSSLTIGAAAGLVLTGCPDTTTPGGDNPFTTSGDDGVTDPTTPNITTSADSGPETDGATSVAMTSSGDDTGPATSSSDGSTSSPPGPATCGNNILEGDEVCDLTQLSGETCESLGHEGGQLSCLLDCSDYNLLGCYICGNDIINDAEDCEGVVPEEVTCESLGFEGGTIGCGADCLWDTSDCSICGDGIQQGFETCDGADFGGETCASLGLGGGNLACTAGCGYDFAGCDIAGIPFGDDGFYAGFALSPGVLPCDDISATGTVTNLTDDSNLVVPIGFTFPVYQVDQTMVNIQSNGNLTFDAAYLSYTNSCVPSVTPPASTLFVFWDDLNPGLGLGEIYYETLGPVGAQRFVVQWDTANYSGDAADLMRFQAVLHEGTGQIDVCYVDTINAANTANGGAEATAGIQLSSVTGLGYSCDMPNLVDGTLLMYVPI